VDVSDGNKIYIEINPELILDPTMIKDEGTSTDFSKGFGIGEIKSTPDYPTHSNYLPLYEIDNEGLEEDKREPISINDAVLEDSTLIADIINQIITVETEINKIETN
jgi:hypothetical protein